MLEALFELLFEFFGEFILQLVFELFGGAFKAGWYKVTGRDKPTTVIQETGWAVITGCVAGAVTVWLFPMLAIRLPWLQILNLLLAPVAAGVLVERGIAPSFGPAPASPARSGGPRRDRQRWR